MRRESRCGGNSLGDVHRQGGREIQDMARRGQWKVSVGKKWLMRNMTKVSRKTDREVKKDSSLGGGNGKGGGHRWGVWH